VELVEADLAPGDGYDLVVSNPPYVHADEYPALEPEVREWEPRLALVDGGQTERILSSPRGTWLVLEVHEGDADGVEERMRALGYADVRTTPDLNGRPRVVEGRWTP
jgi:release factor glutamine methyltransferase